MHFHPRPDSGAHHYRSVGTCCRRYCRLLLATRLPASGKNYRSVAASARVPESVVFASGTSGGTHAGLSSLENIPLFPLPTLELNPPENETPIFSTTNYV
uniref:Uncharacterized protein n=1 Tax=Cacopsylla melanoneura TaxID=428564 RepID=A0A8D8Y399_9HEMI